jgi:hypothetical protein
MKKLLRKEKYSSAEAVKIKMLYDEIINQEVNSNKGKQ